MRRLVLRWVALVLFVAICATAFVNLGEWQLRRLHERRDRNAVTIANESAPVAPLESVMTGPVGQAQQWRRVQVTGTFDPNHQFVVRNRDNGDARGYEVVTPLATGSGRHVLVDRGFIPIGGGQQIPTTGPPPPTGQVTLVGHVRSSEPGKKGAVDPVDGQVRLVNSTALQAALPYPVQDGYVGLLQISVPQAGGFQAVQTPELSDGPHFWYAVQWFMFAAIGIAGVVVFIRGDLQERRAERNGTPAGAADPLVPRPVPVEGGTRPKG